MDKVAKELELSFTINDGVPPLAIFLIYTSIEMCFHGGGGGGRGSFYSAR